MNNLSRQSIIFGYVSLLLILIVPLLVKHTSSQDVFSKIVSGKDDFDVFYLYYLGVISATVSLIQGIISLKQAKSFEATFGVIIAVTGIVLNPKVPLFY